MKGKGKLTAVLTDVCCILTQRVDIGDETNGPVKRQQDRAGVAR